MLLDGKASAAANDSPGFPYQNAGDASQGGIAFAAATGNIVGIGSSGLGRGRISLSCSETPPETTACPPRPRALADQPTGSSFHGARGRSTAEGRDRQKTTAPALMSGAGPEAPRLPAADMSVDHPPPSPPLLSPTKRRRQSSPDRDGHISATAYGDTSPTSDGGRDGLSAGAANGSSGKPGQSSNFRNVSACNRCRVRKNRCDQRLPSCATCEKASVACVGYDPITRKEIPRRSVPREAARAECQARKRRRAED